MLFTYQSGDMKAISVMRCVTDEIVHGENYEFLDREAVSIQRDLALSENRAP